MLNNLYLTYFSHCLIFAFNQSLPQILNLLLLVQNNPLEVKTSWQETTMKDILEYSVDHIYRCGSTGNIHQLQNARIEWQFLSLPPPPQPPPTLLQEYMTVELLHVKIKNNLHHYVYITDEWYCIETKQVTLICKRYIL